jgi:hypothetical protein
VLDAIREELRKRNYLPIPFDFDKPSRDTAETVSTLVHMARFVIADVTEARSIAAELEHIVPHLQSVAFQTLILKSEYEYALFDHIRKFCCVLQVYQYDSIKNLQRSLPEKVIVLADAKAKEL